MSNRRELFITLVGCAADVIEWRLRLLHCICRLLVKKLPNPMRAGMSAVGES